MKKWIEKKWINNSIIEWIDEWMNELKKIKSMSKDGLRQMIDIQRKFPLLWYTLISVFNIFKNEFRMYVSVNFWIRLWGKNVGKDNGN